MGTAHLIQALPARHSLAAHRAAEPRRRTLEAKLFRLERKLDRQLHLTWIAHARTQEAAEVEQPRRD